MKPFVCFIIFILQQRKYSNILIFFGGEIVYLKNTFGCNLFVLLLLSKKHNFYFFFELLYGGAGGNTNSKLSAFKSYSILDDS